MKQHFLDQFLLVGETNLALRYGHRKSTDIDLFSDMPFDSEWIISQLQANYPSFRLLSKNDHMIFGFIDNIKIDCVYLPYNFLHTAETIENIRFASVEDIIAMKLSAIANRGSKKDFRDLNLCCNKTVPYTIEHIIQLYQKRYKTDDIFHIIRSLIYFDDADQEPDPICLKDKKRPQIKKEMMYYCSSFL